MIFIFIHFFMKYYIAILGLVLISMIRWWFSHTQAGNTTIWLTILWSGDTNTGSVNTWTNNTGSVSTWNTNTGVVIPPSGWWWTNTNQGWWTFWWWSNIGNPSGIWNITPAPTQPLPLPPVQNPPLTPPKQPILPLLPSVDLSWLDEIKTVINTWASGWISTWFVIQYNPEVTSAYEHAKSVWITNAENINTARVRDPITRWELAKMIVEYAKKVDKKPIPSRMDCQDNTYVDVWTWDRQNPYVKDICNLWIMWWKNDGLFTIEYFRPRDIVTRAELWTILSRYLYGNTYMWDTSSTYYEKHLIALKSAWIVNKIDVPWMTEIRGNVMVILHRLSTKK